MYEIHPCMPYANRLRSPRDRSHECRRMQSHASGNQKRRMSIQKFVVLSMFVWMKATRGYKGDGRGSEYILDMGESVLATAMAVMLWDVRDIVRCNVSIHMIHHALCVGLRVVIDVVRCNVSSPDAVRCMPWNIMPYYVSVRCVCSILIPVDIASFSKWMQ